MKYDELLKDALESVPFGTHDEERGIYDLSFMMLFPEKALLRKTYYSNLAYARGTDIDERSFRLDHWERLSVELVTGLILAMTYKNSERVEYDYKVLPSRVLGWLRELRVISVDGKLIYDPEDERTVSRVRRNLKMLCDVTVTPLYRLLSKPIYTVHAGGKKHVMDCNWLFQYAGITDFSNKPARKYITDVLYGTQYTNELTFRPPYETKSVLEITVEALQRAEKLLKQVKYDNRRTERKTKRSS